MIKTHQTKQEKGIGSLPRKEFRIMIVKMIQNLESKMKIQIETWIEKMQVMFAKDAEEIKNSQSVINNAITD